MSLTQDILRLYAEGLSRAEIARQLNCSRANITITLQRHFAWDHRISAIPLASQKWLIDRAKKVRVRPRDMAARLLMEIIDMYMTGDH